MINGLINVNIQNMKKNELESFLNTAKNMREYGFLLTRILPYNCRFCPFTEEYGSVKARILAYFMQWEVFHSHFRGSCSRMFFKTGVH